MRRFTFRHLPVTPVRTAILAGLGAGAAIGALGYLTQIVGLVLLMAPLGASCVLLFAAPTSPLSQPVNVIGGHIIAGLFGVAAHFVFPNTFWMAGVAVGLAISALMLLRLVHPPAGATALVAYISATSWTFLLFPVAVGSITLVAIATAYHRLTNTTYPVPVPVRPS
jgi:CBS-domain-containing membrane protein